MSTRSEPVLPRKGLLKVLGLERSPLERFRDDTTVEVSRFRRIHESKEEHLQSTKDLDLRLRDRWAADRSIALDQVGPEIFSEMRAVELENTPGANYLARAYGMRTAKRLREQHQQAGLRAENANSSRYQRGEQHENFRGQCLNIYRKELEKEDLIEDEDLIETDHIVFVHSPAAAARLEAHLNLEPEGTGAVVSVQPLVHGLVAVVLSGPETAELAEGKLEKIGATPSNYEVMRQFDAQPRAEVRLDPSLRNDEQLDSIVEAGGSSAASAHANLPPQHPMKAVATSAVSLVGGLQETFGNQKNTPEFRHNILIGNALKVLRAIVLASRTMTEDSSRFFSAYQAMVDELFVILAATKP
jgi:hypothetical protein